MTNLYSVHALGGLLALLLLAKVPVDAPASNVLTLMSPLEEAGGHFGESVAGVGDVNRDAVPDVIVAAPNEDPGISPDSAGRAYLLSGQDGSLLFELVSPNEELGGLFGLSVAGAGDVNGDGVPDVIVAAPNEDPGSSPDSAGRAYVFGGQDGSLLFELVSPNEQAGGLFGYSVAGAGDVNRDGFADVIVGARQETTGTSPASVGRAYVFSGHDGNVLLELVSPTEESLHFGYSVAGAADVNRDGFADLIVGDPVEDHAYVFSGHDGSLLLDLVSPNEESGGDFGNSVASAGDVDGDGISDLVVAAFHELDLKGRAYVFNGHDGSLLLELVSPNGEELGDFGISVAGMGDVNRDGFADVLVGASEEAGNGPSGAGRAYVFSGRSGMPLLELVSPNEEFEGAFGCSVSGAGDVNQDGLPDVVAGAHAEDPGTSPVGAGRAYVFLSPGSFRVNSGGPSYTDTNGSVFVADRAYVPGGFGYFGGLEHTFDQPIGGTDDDPLYQDVRVARKGDGDGIFSYRFDVPSPARYDVTLYLMAPALDGAGVVMDVQAEGDLAFDDLDVAAEAGGKYQALVKTFAVDVTDGTLDLRFRAVNKAAVVSAIAVAAQTARALPAGKVGGVR
jgi:hypothetical protein